MGAHGDLQGHMTMMPLMAAHVEMLWGNGDEIASIGGPRFKITMQ